MNELGRRILVVGMARSGIAAAQLLANRGYEVIINDQKTEIELGEALDMLPEANIVRRLGENPRSLLPGVDCIVISPGVPITSSFIALAKEQGIPVIGEVELASRLSPGVLVAITGTNGKTTTTSLTADIFKNAGRTSYAVGNIGLPWTSLVDRMQPTDVVVAEISSFQLESIDSFRPRVSAVLNITEDHLNRHGSMEEYIRLKKRIFENQRDEDIVVLNYDDPTTRAMAQDARCRVVFFSRKEVIPGGVSVVDGCITADEGGSERMLCPIEDVKIPGAHNLEDALAASAIAYHMGVPAPVIRHSLRTFSGVEHRIEFVREVNGVRYINDSKGTNVDASIKSVQAMRKPTVLLLGGYDKKTDFTPLCQEIARSHIVHVVALGETREQIVDTLHRVGFSSVSRADSFAEAVAMAAANAKPGYSVLLSPACASFDMFKDFEERGRTFKEIVNAM